MTVQYKFRFPGWSDFFFFLQISWLRLWLEINHHISVCYMKRFFQPTVKSNQAFSFQIKLYDIAGEAKTLFIISIPSPTPV